MKKFLSLAVLGAICFAQNLPAQAAENLVKNSSFEVGTDGFGIVRAEYVQTGQRTVPYYGMTLDRQQKYHGDVSLRIDNPNAGSMRFFSRAFSVDAKKQYFLSFAAKAGLPNQELAVNLETAEGSYGETGKTISVGTEWARYSIGPLTIPNGRSLCRIQLMWGIYNRLQRGTSLWLDAMQVSEAPETDYAPRQMELGIANGLPRQYTQSRAQDYPVSFKVRNNGGVAAPVSIRYQVVDEYFDKVVSQNTIKAFQTNANSTLQRPIANVSPHKRGKYILKADLLDGSGHAVDHSEFGFAVIDSVKKGPGQFTDAFSVSDIVNQGAGRPMGPQGESSDLWAFYGSSVDETFDFRAQAGDRWIRSWDFNWSNIEPEKGKFNWTLTDIFLQKTAERGIRVFPTLGDEFILDNNRDIPKWLLDDPDTKLVPRGMDPRQQVALVSFKQWESYLRAVVGRYKGRITAYEIFNEPNLWITPDQYVGYLKVAYQTIKDVDPQAKVVAFGSSQDYGGAAVQFLEDCFKQDALKYCDVVSFHPYGARLDWSTPLSAQGMNLQIRQLMNRYGGAGKGLWVSELYFTYKPGNPEIDENYQGRAENGTGVARRYLIDLATGVGRSFTVPELNYFALFAPKSWAVNNHLSVGGEPSTTFVIYNTLTRFFEGAKPQGEVNIGEKNKLYLYSKGAASMAAAWSFDLENTPSLLTIPNAAGKIQVFDIMGNPSDQVKTQGKNLLVTLTNSPVYFLPTQNMAAQLRPLLSKARAKSGKWLELSAGFTRKNQRPAIVVQLANPQAHAVRVALDVGIDLGHTKLQAPSQQVLLSANSVSNVVVPVNSEAPWQVARIALRAKFGSQTIEKNLEVKSHPALDCPRLNTPVQLDGHVGAAEWQDANQFTINGREHINEGEANWQGPDDLSAMGRLKYDAKGLYLGIQVKDQMRRQASAESPIYDNDAVELFLDAFPNRNLGESFYQKTTAQILFGLPNQPFESLRQALSPSSGKSFDLANITSATKAREGGYEVEILIPWKQMNGFVPSPGVEIGFNLSLDDADEGPKRKVQMVWAGKGNNYENRTLFGRIILR